MKSFNDYLEMGYDGPDNFHDVTDKIIYIIDKVIPSLMGNKDRNEMQPEIDNLEEIRELVGRLIDLY